MKKKAIISLSILFVLLLTAVYIYQKMHGDGGKWSDLAGRIITALLPLLLLFRKRISFPLPLIFGFYVLLFLTFFLGAMLKFYDRFKWWDTVLHVYGGGFMAFLAISLFQLCISQEIRPAVSAWLLFLFVLSFAVFSSAIWEILEFTASVFGALKPDSQKDTMTDQIAGLSGALVVACYAAIVRRKINQRQSEQ